jgi:hypothetical protein
VISNKIRLWKFKLNCNLTRMNLYTRFASCLLFNGMLLLVFWYNLDYVNIKQPWNGLPVTHMFDGRYIYNETHTGINTSMSYSSKLKLKVEVNNQLFGSNIIHQINSSLLISPEGVCKPVSPYLLILIPSVPSHVKQRMGYT